MIPVLRSLGPEALAIQVRGVGDRRMLDGPANQLSRWAPQAVRLRVCFFEPYGNQPELQLQVASPDSIYI